jgi:hypothetical protein
MVEGGRQERNRSSCKLEMSVQLSHSHQYTLSQAHSTLTNKHVASRLFFSFSRSDLSLTTIFSMLNNDKEL